MASRGGGRPTVYKTSDGTRVPGVTTILSRFKDSGGLIHWAWTEGIEGRDYRATRDSAASAGSITHSMIEAHIHGTTCPHPSLLDLFPGYASLPSEEREATAKEYDRIVGRALNAYTQYLAWRETTRLEIVATEVPLVSEAHRYGGTIDAIGRLGGRLVLPDWKTSNRIYADYLLQTAAYVRLWEEHHPADKIEQVVLIRFDKDSDASSQHTWGLDTLERAWRMFSLLREAYDLDAQLRKAAA